MKSSRFDIVFYIVISLALFILTYLSVHLAGRIVNVREIIRLGATIIMPVPIVIYMLCFAVPVIPKKVKRKNRHAIFAIILFLSSIFLSIIIFQSYENITQTVFQDNVIIPSLINSSVIMLFAVNHITKNDERIAGLLSGILLGMAIFIFIF